MGLAGRRAFTGQPARSRGDDERTLVLAADVVTNPDGGFAGFRGTAETRQEPAQASVVPTRTAAFDHALDEALRSPLDRIIETAERIVERADGPLRNNYASYGGDIATAARHLLSVIQSMSEDPAQGHTSVDLAALAAEAVVMLEAQAEERHIQIGFDATRSLPANGEERAVIQILVNLIGNAVRHSPEGASVQLQFSRTAGTASVTVADGARESSLRTSSESSNDSNAPTRGPAAPASASPSRAGSRARWAAMSLWKAAWARARASR